MQAEVQVNIAGGLVDDALQARYLHEGVKVHDVEGEEADCFLVVERSDDERTACADLDFEQLDVARETQVLDLLKLIPALGHVPVNHYLHQL